jgi:hypothetical protein
LTVNIKQIMYVCVFYEAVTTTGHKKTTMRNTHGG